MSVGDNFQRKNKSFQTIYINVNFKNKRKVWRRDEKTKIHTHTHTHTYIYIYIYIYMYICTGDPLQYSCLENPMDGGAWWAAVHGVAKSRTRLSDFTFTFHFHALEKEMAAHPSVLAWRIPGTGEPGGLPSMGSHRVRHDWRNLAAAASCDDSGSFENICIIGKWVCYLSSCHIATAVLFLRFWNESPLKEHQKRTEGRKERGKEGGNGRKGRQILKPSTYLE